MTNEDTSRSDKLVKEFKASDTQYKRKIQIFKKQFNADPHVVFKQLCPSREADWINGWSVDLVYTKTGYVEPLCVFRTPESNIFGSGLWMITKFEPNTNLELVVVQEEINIIEYTKIHIIDNGDGTCEGIWEVTLTATSEKGNAAIDCLSDNEPPFLEELEHYLMHGYLMGS